MPFVPNHLSVLGIIHTAISIIAILFAIIALVKYGKISTANVSGLGYISFTAFACLTALPIMKTGHLTGGHYLAVIILILLAIGVYANKIPGLKKAADYIQIIAISTTLFLSMVPTTVETLTRVPISHPIASSPADPKIQMCLTVFVVIYLFGVTYQLLKLRKTKKRLGTTTLV